MCKSKCRFSSPRLSKSKMQNKLILVEFRHFLKWIGEKKTKFYLNMFTFGVKFIWFSIPLETWQPILPYSASAKEFVPTSQTLPVEEGGQTEEDEQVFEGRNCARCNKLFYVFRDTGECVNREECLYHWGKARSSRKYSCCGRRSKSGKICFPSNHCVALCRCCH